MLFSTIPGLEETKEKLITATKINHLAHALLFHGREGSPNLALALALATYINCQQPGDTDACGNCPSCLKMQKLVHPDLNFSFPLPGAKKNNKSEEEDADNKQLDALSLWRSFALENTFGNLYDWNIHAGFERNLSISKGAAKQIIKTLSLKSFEGGYKMMLIWSPETMHPAAANAILKILEEPPEKTIFLMVTHHADNLLTTILSRTQKIMVRGFNEEEIKNHLVEQELCTADAANKVAAVSDGNMREAIKRSQELEDQNTAFFRDWLRECYSAELNNIIAFTEKIFEMGKEAQKSLILTGINTMREGLLNRSQLDKLMKSHDQDREFIVNLSKNVLSDRKISLIYELLNDCHYYIDRNANIKIMFLDLSFNLIKILKSKQ